MSQLAPVQNEVVFEEVNFQPTSKVPPLAMVVTDQSVMLWQQGFFGPKWVRVPHEDVREVQLQRSNKKLITIAGVAIAALGVLAAAGVWLAGPGANLPGKAYALGPALIFLGVAMPLMGTGRKLVIKYARGTYKWKPPMMVFASNRRDADQAMASCAAAMRKAGHQVFEAQA